MDDVAINIGSDVGFECPGIGPTLDPVMSEPATPNGHTNGNGVRRGSPEWKAKLSDGLKRHYSKLRRQGKKHAGSNGAVGRPPSLDIAIERVEAEIEKLSRQRSTLLAAKRLLKS